LILAKGTNTMATMRGICDEDRDKRENKKI
jgi:hypothetical protein